MSAAWCPACKAWMDERGVDAPPPPAEHTSDQLRRDGAGIYTHVSEPGGSES